MKKLFILMAIVLFCTACKKPCTDYSGNRVDCVDMQVEIKSQCIIFPKTDTNKLILEWTTQNEVGVKGFFIDMRYVDEQYKTIEQKFDLIKPLGADTTYDYELPFLILDSGQPVTYNISAMDYHGEVAVVGGFGVSENTPYDNVITSCP